MAITLLYINFDNNFAMRGTRAKLNPSIVSHTWRDAKKCLVSKFCPISPEHARVTSIHIIITYCILIINEVVDVLGFHHLTPPHHSSSSLLLLTPPSHSTTSTTLHHLHHHKNPCHAMPCLTKMHAKALTCFNFFNFQPVLTKFCIDIEHVILTNRMFFVFRIATLLAGK
jgi:hypothetical protein